MAVTVKVKTRCRIPVPEIKLFHILCTFKKNLHSSRKSV